MKINVPYEAISFDDVLLEPQHGVLETRKNADISTELISRFRINIPIISANMPAITEGTMAEAMMRIGAYSILHRFNTIQEQNREFKSSHNLDTGISIGLEDWFWRTRVLAKNGARIFCLDTAHADTDKCFRIVEKWRKLFPEYKLIVGNVATGSAALSLCSLGVDAVKVGIGPGAACTTREVTGFGVPQLTAIRNVYMGLHEGVKLIADGGIKNSGDIVKALAAGADSVMIGRLLAGCDEAPNPGEYYGSASKKVNGHNAPEGVEGSVPKTGNVESIIKQLAWGIRSGISYGGARNIKELQNNAKFIKVSSQAAIESGVRF